MDFTLCQAIMQSYGQLNFAGFFREVKEYTYHSAFCNIFNEHGLNLQWNGSKVNLWCLVVQGKCDERAPLRGKAPSRVSFFQISAVPCLYQSFIITLHIQGTKQ